MRDLLPTIARDAYSYRDDTRVPAFPDDRPLIVFDGYCGLCSRLVQFVLRHDKQATYRFIAAQTPLGTALFQHYGLDANNYETFILLHAGRGYFVSDAAIKMAHELAWPWSWSPVLRIVPKAVRDRVYLLIARNRMHFFGRFETCYLPAPDFRARFLDVQIETPALKSAG